MLFDDDPGIMSEVETSSTGFRRGGKQRSSLPVVRTPSKTLERPLGKHENGTHPLTFNTTVTFVIPALFLRINVETLTKLLVVQTLCTDVVFRLFQV